MSNWGVIVEGELLDNVKIGDSMHFQKPDGTSKSITIKQIVKDRKFYDNANYGNYVGLVVEGLKNKNEIKIGTQICVKKQEQEPVKTSYIDSCPQLVQDIKLYANETITKGDINAGLKILAEITGYVAVLGIAFTALTSWAPMIGIPISIATARGILMAISQNYMNLPRDERQIIAKCASFFYRFV